MPSRPSPLSRTSSAASVSSVDSASSTSSKRSRTHFTVAQLAAMERLYHQISHPSREQRTALAQEIALDTHAVGTWFQNKRQQGRKVLRDTTNSASAQPLKRSSSTHSISSRSLCSAKSSTRRPCLTSRVSLDRVAARSERPIPAVPRTPPRIRKSSSSSTTTHSSIPSGTSGPWDDMLSSPIQAPDSPPSVDYVIYGRNSNPSKSLEWACAAARVSTKIKDANSDSKGDETEEDEDMTMVPVPIRDLQDPANILMRSDNRSDSFLNFTVEEEEKTVAPKQDMVNAAMLLCSLGR